MLRRKLERPGVCQSDLLPRLGSAAIDFIAIQEHYNGLSRKTFPQVNFQQGHFLLL
jgi:hypothetical protein